MSSFDSRSIVNPRGYYLSLKLCNMEVSALIDTGASVSVIDGALVEKSESLQESFVGNVQAQNLVGLGGARIKVTGQVLCQFTAPNITFKPHILKVIPEKPSVSVILGMDFLKSNGIIINVADNIVQMKTNTGQITRIPVTTEAHGPRDCIFLKEETLLHPNEKKMVVLKCNLEHSKEGQMEPCLVHGAAWKLASALGRIDNGTVYGQIMNVTDKLIKLRVDTKVGYWQPVCNVLEFEVAENRKDLFEALELSDLDITPTQRLALEAVLDQYREVFSRNENDLGFCRSVTHKIDTEDHPPIRQRYRRLHPPIKELVQKELDRMEELGIITKSNSPWCSPLVPVRKKDGRIRICIDFRKLNSITKISSYPLPNIEDSLIQFSNMKYFSTLDLLSGYHQIALDPPSREKTAFATDRGLYEYCVMPQGACNSPATFQNLMNVMLHGMSSKQASAYLDDILVCGATFEEHLDNLAEVLKRLKDHGLKLSTEKCNLLKSSVPYLGHVLTREGIKTSRKNVDSILALPIPTTVRGLKKLNGMISYYSKFVPNIAVIMEPLYRVTSERKLVWTDECSTALNKVKELLIGDPVLAYPRYGEQDKFIITTDASNRGLGAVLSQCQDGIERVIGYGSVTLNTAQKNYSTTEKELAALRFGVKHFKPYVYGRRFILRTDHKALVYLNQMKNLDQRLMRTYEDLQVGDYEIEYIKGIDNCTADILSRNPLDILDGDREESIDLGFERQPVFLPQGGPSSLFECLCYATEEVESPLQLRRDLTNYLLENLKKYNKKDCSKVKKWVASYNDEEVFTGVDLVPVFVDLFLCDVIVYHRPGPRVVFRNKSSGSEIILECRGGVHFNVLRGEAPKEEASGMEDNISIVRVLHELVEDDETASGGNFEVELPQDGPSSDIGVESCEAETQPDLMEQERRPSVEYMRIYIMLENQKWHMPVKIGCRKELKDCIR